MNTPAVSLLLPVYNAEATLPECLADIAAQEFGDFEVVAVDDGSSDGSPSLLAEATARDSRFRLLSLPENRGIVAALNRGLAASRGAWVARIDADDRMRPNRLARQWAYAVRHPEPDLLGTAIRIFRGQGKPKPGQVLYQKWSNGLLGDRQIKDALFLESPIVHPSFFGKRALFEELGGYRQRPWPEDYDFLWRATLAGAVFAKLPDVLVEKREWPNRLYHTDPRCKPAAMLRAKTHFFLKSLYRNPVRPLIVAGTGSSGRAVTRYLREMGAPPAAFTDTREGPPGRTVMGIPVHRIHAGAAFCRAAPRPFVLACIGSNRGRALVESMLRRQALLEWTDYIRFL